MGTCNINDFTHCVVLLFLFSLILYEFISMYLTSQLAEVVIEEFDGILPKLDVVN